MSTGAFAKGSYTTVCLLTDDAGAYSRLRFAAWWGLPDPHPGPEPRLASMDAQGVVCAAAGKGRQGDKSFRGRVGRGRGKEGAGRGRRGIHA